MSGVAETSPLIQADGGAGRASRGEEEEEEEERESFLARYSKAAVYGALDGIVSVLVAVVVAAVGGSSLATVLTVSFAKVVAGALSMGFGDYLSSKAEVDYSRGERAREEWEVENFIEGERAEMVELYEKLGYEESVAESIVELLSSNPKLFVDSMMVEELGIDPESERSSPVKSGLVNGLSFLACGVVPILPYCAFLAYETAVPHSHLSNWWPLLASCLASLATLVALGFFKGRYSKAVCSSIAQVLAGGVLAAGVGAGIAIGIFKATGVVA